MANSKTERVMATDSNAAEEAPNLHTFITANKTLKTKEYVPLFSKFITYLKEQHIYSYCRKVLTPQSREVTIWDAETDKNRKMLMFASNNYLGMANSPYVKKKVTEAMNLYGVGLGGPPLLNGYTKLMIELEERLAHLKHQESAMVFSSGYAANVGMLVALAQENDHILYDELSHASLFDGMRMTQVPATKFAHNDLVDLEAKLAQLSKTTKDTLFVAVEGVYSMDGDLAPLDKIVPLVKKYGGFLLLDDAHGTGVMGKSGSGTAEHFGVEKQIDLSMGTFSKSFAMTGGFLAGPKDLIDYLRFFARSYMFSAALTPVTLSAVLAGIDVVEKEPELRELLLENARYAIQKLQPFGIISKPEAAIIALKVPDWMDVRNANHFIHEQGIFLNAIEYPAVPEGEERFRISITAEHTRADIDRLAEVLDMVWNSPIVHKT
jgi:glycine C-acetyltransferase